MPVYDYRCTDCNSTYDVFHKGHEVVQDVVCPSCGSLHHKKLMSIPVVSTGTGFSSSYNSSTPFYESSGCCAGGCGMN